MTPNTPAIEQLSFETDGGLGDTARIGLICLQSDQSMEHDMATLVQGSGIVRYHARIPNAMEITPDTLRQMARELPMTAALLPAEFGFDVIGYGCTSGATMIGETHVAELIRGIHPDAQVSNPITACKAALAALNVKRIALVTPYFPEVTMAMQENLRAAGINVNAVASFNESDDFTVARITSDSILDAVNAIGARQDCDGVFVSCTNLRTLPMIARAEAHLGKPVISSNQALAWHMMRLAGSDKAPTGFGQLFGK